MADRAAHARLIRRRRAIAGTIVAVAIAALVVGTVMGADARSRRHPLPSGVGARAPLRHPALRKASLAVREADAIERTRLTVPIVRMAGAQHREIALTFDDGPGPYTPEIVRILTRTHTPATFFEVGEELRWFGAATAQILRLGDPIGDHTWSHPDMARLNGRAQRRELLRDAAAIGDEGAPFPLMYRPPFGRWDAATLRLLAESHMLMVLWSVDTGDWDRPGAGQIVARALAGSRPGAIILMHDAGGDRSQTVAALPRIIRDLRRRGYRLVTVPRLLLDNPAPRRQDIDSVRGEAG
ncbi:MAG TPA: polysaccharide deacetylase family protein [Solirubrobacteraceae bacterium]|nr:polysaccharide deacetylase family protein [Solirubrobacteraceae bacterium]